MTKFYQTDQVEEHGDSVPEIVYHEHQQQQQQQHQQQQQSNEQLPIIENVGTVRKRKISGENSAVVESSFSRNATSSSAATWVECDKCQRKILPEQFSAHYQQVHEEVSTSQKTTQVWNRPDNFIWRRTGRHYSPLYSSLLNQFF